MLGLNGAGKTTAVRVLILRRPSLDDVFMALTGHVVEDEGPQDRRGWGRKRRSGSKEPGRKEPGRSRTGRDNTATVMS